MRSKVETEGDAIQRAHGRSRALVTAVASTLAAAGLVAIGIGTGQGAESATSSERTALARSTDAQLADGLDAARAPGRGDGVDGRSPGPVPASRSVPSSSEAASDTSPDASPKDPPKVSPSDSSPTPTAASHSAVVHEFNGRPIRPVRTLSMKVTAYSPDERSCGASADGITASGFSVETNGGRMVAADPDILPLGSLVSLPGYAGGEVVPVLDVGGAIKGLRLDVLYATHARAVQWGVKTLEVTVWEYADGKPADFRRNRRPAKTR